MLTTSGSTANLANPAQIPTPFANGMQYDVSILNIDYKYTHPGFETTSISVGTLLPFLGFSMQLNADTFFAFSILPYPGSFEKTEIKKLPTREAGELAFAVDIEQEGPSLALNSSFGVGHRFSKEHLVGLSLILNRTGYNRKVFDSEAGLELQKEKRTNDLIEMLLGYSFIGDDFSAAFRLIPFGQEQIHSDKETFSLFGDDKENVRFKEKRPLHVGAALQKTANDFLFLFETRMSFWESVSKSDRNEYDYFDTTSFAGGMQWHWEKNQNLTFSFGYFPTHLGDGLMDTRSIDQVEIIGLQTGDLDGFNRTVVSLGFETNEPLYSITYYLQVQRGSRSVFEDAREYGDHELQVIFLGAGGQYHL